MPMMREMLRFGAVGAIGFVVDGGLLWVLVANDVNPYLARAFSFPIAVIVTWWANRCWTFQSAPISRPLHQFNRYFSVQVIGALSNFTIYSGFLLVLGEAPTIAALGFFVGSFVAMFLNFFGSRVYAFR